jgi:hypothetical protein
VSFLTSMVPLPYRILALALLCAALVAFGWLKGAEHGERRLEQYKLAEQVQINKGMRIAAAQTHAWQAKKDEALNAATKRAQGNAVAAAAARDESRSLRDQLAAADAAIAVAADSAVRKYAAAVNAVFGECADAYLGMAEKASGHASDALMFEQAWPR